MTQHTLNDDEVLAAFRAAFPVGPHLFTPDASNFARAIIAAYQAKQVKALPVLPDAKHAKEWQHDMYTADQLQDYGVACAIHAREVVLSGNNAAWKLMCEKSVAHAREVALSEAKEIAHKCCHAEASLFGDGYNTAAFNIERAIEALKKAGK